MKEKQAASLGFCWGQGSPVLLEQGELLQTGGGQFSARLCFENHWCMELLELTIVLSCRNEAGGEPAAAFFTYTGLSAGPGQAFGDAVRIPLPGFDGTRVRIAVKSARFRERDWNADPPVLLEEITLPPELTKLGVLAEQFQRDFEAHSPYGAAATNLPVSQPGWWWCACGEFHEAFEEGCAFCGVSREWQLDACREERLRARLQEHEQREGLQKEELARREARAQRNQARRVKTAAVVLSALVLLSALGGAGGYLIFREVTYRRGLDFDSRREYVSAFAAFERLGSYRDSKERLAQPEFALISQLQGTWTQRSRSHWEETADAPGADKPMEEYLAAAFTVKGNRILDEQGTVLHTVSRLVPSELPGYSLVVLDDVLDESFYLKVFPDGSVGLWHTGILPYDSDGIYWIGTAERT